MLQRLIHVMIVLSAVAALAAGPAQAQRFDDRDRHERFEHERWERDRWERMHGYGRYYPGPGYYAPPPVFYTPPLRPYYAPPPIYQTPSYGFAVPYR